MRTAALNGDTFRANWYRTEPGARAHYFKQASMNQAESLCKAEFRRIQSLTPMSQYVCECGMCKNLLGSTAVSQESLR